MSQSLFHLPHFLPPPLPHTIPPPNKPYTARNVYILPPPPSPSTASSSSSAIQRKQTNTKRQWNLDIPPHEPAKVKPAPQSASTNSTKHQSQNQNSTPNTHRIAHLITPRSQRRHSSTQANAISSHTQLHPSTPRKQPVNESRIQPRASTASSSSYEPRRNQIHDSSSPEVPSISHPIPGSSRMMHQSSQVIEAPSIRSIAQRTRTSTHTSAVVEWSEETINEEALLAVGRLRSPSSQDVIQAESQGSKSEDPVHSRRMSNSAMNNKHTPIPSRPGPANSSKAIKPEASELTPSNTTSQPIPASPRPTPSASRPGSACSKAHALPSSVNSPSDAVRTRPTSASVTVPEAVPAAHTRSHDAPSIASPSANTSGVTQPSRHTRPSHRVVVSPPVTRSAYRAIRNRSITPAASSSLRGSSSRSTKETE